jgi:hypothetical protein
MNEMYKNVSIIFLQSIQFKVVHKPLYTINFIHNYQVFPYKFLLVTIDKMVGR